MADEEQLRVLKQGVEAWNTQRRRADDITVDLSGVNLSGANLSVAHLYEADLNGADLSEGNLRNANLSGAQPWSTCWPTWMSTLSLRRKPRCVSSKGSSHPRRRLPNEC
jgi:hypothetical protein